MAEDTLDTRTTTNLSAVPTVLNLNLKHHTTLRLMVLTSLTAMGVEPAIKKLSEVTRVNALSKLPSILAMLFLSLLSLKLLILPSPALLQLQLRQTLLHLVVPFHPLQVLLALRRRLRSPLLKLLPLFPSTNHPLMINQGKPPPIPNKMRMEVFKMLMGQTHFDARGCLLVSRAKIPRALLSRCR
jgi:hypothetical protein